MDYKTILRIDTILTHISQVLNDTNSLSIEELKASNLLLRATCFSIVQIGETMNKLEKDLGAIYLDIPWSQARKMRNVIVHDYGGTNIEDVYLTIKNDLPKLKESFLIIKDELLALNCN